MEEAEEAEVIDSQLLTENVGFLDEFDKTFGVLSVSSGHLHQILEESHSHFVKTTQKKKNILSQKLQGPDISVVRNASLISQKVVGEKVENSSLKDWGLPEDIIRKYEEKGISKMFPWQVECLSNAKVLTECSNLVYSAPTSAGKTLVAEILTIKTILERQKKVIVILPFVSIVREKMFYFQDILSSSGFRVEGFMGSQSPPGGFQSVHVAICTIEKANSLINRLLDDGNISELGAVVVDELHLLGDPHRGYILELLLSKVKYVSLKYDEVQIQIIGMSATLPNLEKLAEWLEAELFVTEFRPIPLEEFCLVENNFYDKNGTLVTSSGSSDQNESVLQICLETIKEGCSVLIFCMTKNRCENIAKNIAAAIYKLGCSADEIAVTLRQQLKSECIAEVLEQLKNCPAGLDNILKNAISFGVAYHHAGLTFEERDIIEGAFKSGAIRILVATSTLSSGVNLPARKVIIRSALFQRKPINILTYKQMVGRAGRMGKDTKGESILICSKEEKKLGFELMKGALDPVESCLGSEDKFMRAVLEIIASEVVSGENDLDLYSKCTLLFTQEGEHLEKKFLNKTTEHLLMAELIRAQVDGQEMKFSATALGKACLSSSVAPTEGVKLFLELQRARECLVLENDLHLIYLVTPYSVSSQWQDIDWLHMLSLWQSLTISMKKVGQLVGVQESNLFFYVRRNKITFGKESGVTKNLDIFKRFYTALALQDLVNEVPLSEVALKFQCGRGFLQGLQQAASTFAGMVTAFCHQLGWKNMETLISQFQNRLYFGVHSELLELMKLPSLNGIRARALFDAGFETITSVASAETEDIENTLYKAVPFQSEKEREGDDSDDMRKRKKLKNIWITGCCAMTVKEAAENLILEARKYLQYEIGVKEIKWETVDRNQSLSCNIHAISQIASTSRENIEDKIKHTPDKNKCKNNNKNQPTKGLNENVDTNKLNAVDSDKNVTESTKKERSKSRLGKVEKAKQNEPLQEIEQEKAVEADINVSERIFESDVDDFEIKVEVDFEEQDLSGALPKNFKTAKENQEIDDDFKIKDEIDFEQDVSDALLKKIKTAEENHEMRTSSPIINGLRKNTSNTENTCINIVKEETDIMEAIEPKDEVIWDSMNYTETAITNITKVPASNSKYTSTNTYITCEKSEKNVNSNSAVKVTKTGSRNASPLVLKDTTGNTSKSIAKDISLFSSDGDNSSLFEESLPLDLIPSKLLDDRSNEVSTYSTINQGRSSNDNIKSNTITNAFKSPKLEESYNEEMHLLYEDETQSETESIYSPNIARQEKSSPKEIDCPNNSKISESPEDIVFESQNLLKIKCTKTYKTPFKRKAKVTKNGSSSIQPSPKKARLTHVKPDISVKPDGKCCEEIDDVFILNINGQKVNCFVLYRNNLSSEKLSIIEAATEVAIYLDIVKLEKPNNPNFIGSKILLPKESSSETTTNLNCLIHNVVESLEYLEGMSLYYYNRNETVSCVYLDFNELENEVLREVKIKLMQWLANKSLNLKVVNFKNDVKQIKRFFGDKVPLTAFDVSLANWILGEEQIDKQFGIQFLQRVTRDYYAGHRKIIELPPKAKSRKEIINRGCMASYTLMNEAKALEIKLAEKFPNYKDIMTVESRVSKILAESELYGVLMDRSEAETLLNQVRRALEALQKKANKICGHQFNINSPPEVAKALRLHEAKSVSKMVLSAHGSTLASVIIYWRKLNTILNNILIPIVNNVLKYYTRVKPSYSIFSSTGRISMSEPNLQNVPRTFAIPLKFLTEDEEWKHSARSQLVFNCRDLIKAKEGHVLVAGDYCQLEMRILTHHCKDQALTRIMRSKGDVFKSIAALWGNVSEREVDDDLRQKAKQLCYGILYGMGVSSLCLQLDVTTEEASQFMADFYKTYPRIRVFTSSVVKECKRRLYVETLMKRRRYLTHINSIDPAKRMLAERQAVNTTIQGSAADIAKAAMCSVDKTSTELPYQPQLILQMHDELIYEVPETHKEDFVRLLKKSMEHTIKLYVPLPVKCKIGKTWGSMEEFEIV